MNSLRQKTVAVQRSSLRVAIGPERPEFGSWQWLGRGLADNLCNLTNVETFGTLPVDCDVSVFIKALPEVAQLQELRRRSRIVFCPVDLYGSLQEIEDDHARLTLCDHIVVHACRLLPYFRSYSPTTFLDHPLKFAAAPSYEGRREGPILWIGVRTNLPPLVEYVNRVGLPAPLLVLTNPEQADGQFGADFYGFTARTSVTVQRWSPETHLTSLQNCRAAIDIKGNDFRSRHKPAAKALDYLASGMPLAMNASANSVAEVRHKGFEICSPDDTARWLSTVYEGQTRQFAQRLWRELSVEALTRQWWQLIESLANAESSPCRAVVAAATDGTSNSSNSSIIPTRGRIAIVSLLFNWPSTGGGTVHTAEAARFLAADGYEVRHFIIQYSAWHLGELQSKIDWPIEIVPFTDAEWSRESIQRRIRERVARFAPDAVLITDSWSFKPRLAEALREFPYYLRLAAQECLCPLNNVRLLLDEQGGFASCPRQQLATPAQCRECVRRRSAMSGQLHRAERELAGFFDDDYQACLQRSFAEAAGVLVVNPLIAENVKPFCNAAHVIPSGFDPARFPWPWPVERAANRPLQILFAGLVYEPMKGFSVLAEAAAQIWESRRDFVLLATADPVGTIDVFTEYVGWHDQKHLPTLMHQADIIVCPTIAEEALGRTAVEAMGAGRPVVASRIGGLSFTVDDGVTGLLCRPGDATDLAQKINRLLDDPSLRERMGTAGRQKFEREFAWPAVLERHYRPLFAKLGVATSPGRDD